MKNYWNVPRELIYRERENLNDFGVKDSHSLNGRLFQLLSEYFLSANGADTLLLQCFNNAYYLCTIILLEDLPHLKVDKYEENLLKMKVQWNRDACAASFAMAYEMLQLCEPKYQKDSLLLKAIHHRFRYNEWNGKLAAETFYELIDKVEKGGIFLSKNEFTPRNIVEIIEDVGDSKPYLLVHNVEYICERLACIDDPQRRIFGADLAIAHLKGFLQETYEDNGYDPKTKSFEPAVPGTFGAAPDFEESFWRDVNPIKEAIEYISEHYPTKDKHDSMEKKAEPSHIPEIENLQAKILELESKLTCQEGQLVEANKNNAQQAIRIKELEAENKSLQGQLKEAHTIPDTVTAQQKVRMELARKLMIAAGVNEDILAKWGNKDKAGTVMGTMLDIVPSTCKTYLSDPYINHEHHKSTVDKINPLLEALGLKFKL